MTTMNISLPDEMKDWIEKEARDESYANTSEFVRELVRRERRRKSSLAELRRLIQDGLDSGVSARSFDEIIAAAKATARERGLLDA